MSTEENNQEIARDLLRLVVENFRGSRTVLDLAMSLHLEALNVGIRTARLGEDAKTFVPIAGEIGDAMKRLRKQTTVYQAFSEDFIHSIALHLKMLRLARLFDRAIDQQDGTGAPGGLQSALRDRLAGQLQGASRQIEETSRKLTQVTFMLRDIAFSGKYTSDLARIESVKMSGLNANLTLAAATLSKLLGQVSQEVEEMGERLASIDQLLTGFAEDQAGISQPFAEAP